MKRKLDKMKFKKNSKVCPYCGDNEYVHWQTIYEDKKVVIECLCKKCAHEWFQIYKFADRVRYE